MGVSIVPGAGGWDGSLVPQITQPLAAIVAEWKDPIGGGGGSHGWGDNSAQWSVGEKIPCLSRSSGVGGVLGVCTATLLTVNATKLFQSESSAAYLLVVFGHACLREFFERFPPAPELSAQSVKGLSLVRRLWTVMQIWERTAQIMPEVIKSELDGWTLLSHSHTGEQQMAKETTGYLKHSFSLIKL